MMKYYVLKSSNGNVVIDSEWDNLNSAKVAYHNTCKVYWNSPDVIIGYVAIANSELTVIPGYKECISHPEPVTEEETTE